MGNKNFVAGKTLLLVHEQLINFEYAQREMKSASMDYTEMKLQEFQEGLHWQLLVLGGQIACPHLVHFQASTFSRRLHFCAPLWGTGFSSWFLVKVLFEIDVHWPLLALGGHWRSKREEKTLFYQQKKLWSFLVTMSRQSEERLTGESGGTEACRNYPLEEVREGAMQITRQSPMSMKHWQTCRGVMWTSCGWGL